jgi:ribonuclease D
MSSGDRTEAATLTNIRYHEGDLGNLSSYRGFAAVDTEAMGLRPGRDRLCLVQLSPGDGSVDVVRIAQGQTRAPNLRLLLTDPTITKIFHFARFDVAMLKHALGIEVSPIWCTKIASRLVRTYTDRHGLKDILRDLLGLEISKQQQSSDWGAESLSEAQLEYAASDVLHLHALKDALEARLKREGRLALAEACFRFLPIRAELDLLGWAEEDIFAHS